MTCQKWIKRWLEMLTLEWTLLTNHFFVPSLRNRHPSSAVTSRLTTSSLSLAQEIRRLLCMKSFTKLNVFRMSLIKQKLIGLRRPDSSLFCLQVGRQKVRHGHKCGLWDSRTAVLFNSRIGWRSFRTDLVVFLMLWGKLVV